MYVVPSVHLYVCLSKLPQDFVSLKQLLLKYGLSCYYKQVEESNETASLLWYPSLFEEGAIG